ncbi:hypothetical protein SO694_00015261 [Aureococcus anophagefferens]|uniref:HMG box domain-containing protein n=1 Tax=Aureococcus anophagefferens TaxID=44056 RepID=A0ABR1G2K5_AURAN
MADKVRADPCAPAPRAFPDLPARLPDPRSLRSRARRAGGRRPVVRRLPPPGEANQDPAARVAGLDAADRERDGAAAKRQYVDGAKRQFVGAKHQRKRSPRKKPKGAEVEIRYDNDGSIDVLRWPDDAADAAGTSAAADDADTKQLSGKQFYRKEKRSEAKAAPSRPRGTRRGDKEKQSFVEKALSAGWKALDDGAKAQWDADAPEVVTKQLSGEQFHRKEKRGRAPRPRRAELKAHGFDAAAVAAPGRGPAGGGFGRGRARARRQGATATPPPPRAFGRGPAGALAKAKADAAAAKAAKREAEARAALKAHGSTPLPSPRASSRTCRGFGRAKAAKREAEARAALKAHGFDAAAPQKLLRDRDREREAVLRELLGFEHTGLEEGMLAGEPLKVIDVVYDERDDWFWCESRSQSGEKELTPLGSSSVAAEYNRNKLVVASDGSLLTGGDTAAVYLYNADSRVDLEALESLASRSMGEGARCRVDPREFGATRATRRPETYFNDDSDADGGADHRDALILNNKEGMGTRYVPVGVVTRRQVLSLVDGYLKEVPGVDLKRVPGIRFRVLPARGHEHERFTIQPPHGGFWAACARANAFYARALPGRGGRGGAEPLYRMTAIYARYSKEPRDRAHR